MGSIYLMSHWESNDVNKARIKEKKRRKFKYFIT